MLLTSELAYQKAPTYSTRVWYILKMIIYVDLIFKMKTTNSLFFSVPDVLTVVIDRLSQHVK